MKSSTTKTILVGAALFLGGCANFGAGQTMKTDKGPFFTALQKEYRGLAKLELNEADFFDAAFFYQRANRAARGEAVGPQGINERKLPSNLVSEMTAARDRLVAALAAGTATKPEVAARAQAGFDCWMQEQEENFQPDDIAACKRSFLAALDELTIKAAPVAQPMPAPAPAPMAMPAVPAPVVITFGFDKSRVTLAASAIIKDLAAKAKAAKVTRILIDAHADKAGPVAYNQRLAAARVNSISAAFVTQGIPASMIQTRSFGEARPAVATPDGQRLRVNRRVEISFERN